MERCKGGKCIGGGTDKRKGTDVPGCRGAEVHRCRSLEEVQVADVQICSAHVQWCRGADI